MHKQPKNARSRATRACRQIAKELHQSRQLNQDYLELVAAADSRARAAESEARYLVDFLATDRADKSPRARPPPRLATAVTERLE